MKGRDGEGKRGRGGEEKGGERRGRGREGSAPLSQIPGSAPGLTLWKIWGVFWSQDFRHSNPISAYFIIV